MFSTTHLSASCAIEGDTDSCSYVSVSIRTTSVSVE